MQISYLIRYFLSIMPLIPSIRQLSKELIFSESQISSGYGKINVWALKNKPLGEQFGCINY